MATMPLSTTRRKPKSRNFRPDQKLSRQVKPQDMSLEAWQRELRRQFGRDQAFTLNNLGEQPFFSEFQVTNPQTKNSYRVAIRGPEAGDNFCTCPDFATNTLGTCKHIEFTLAQFERKRGGKAALANGYQPPYSEVYLHYGAQREVRFRPGSVCPVELARLAGKYFGPEGTLLPEAFGKFDTFLSKASVFDHELRCKDDALAFVAEVRDAERRREIVAEAFPRGMRSAAFKKLLKANLYDYQADGALFAARAGRCLIGDEMGLGKTIQAIAVAEIMARHFGVERVLIVCPTSLKHQWQREIERFADRSVQVIGGLRDRRQKNFAADSFFKITNYDTVHRDLDLIQQLNPDLVILDEAQRIKNWSTRVARSVKKIVSPYAIVLTGTPLENRLEELVSIVQFVDRFRLGPTFRLMDEHQVRDAEGRVVGYRALDRLGATLKPILLRRNKSQVLDQLPSRLDKNFFVPMTAIQRKHHEENREIVARIVSKWRRYHFLSEVDQRRLMIALQNMRMSCDSSYLLDQESDHSVKPDELMTLLDEILETPDTKVVIFSQWVRMHELVQVRLRKKGLDHVFFHGSVPTEQRAGLVDRFREDPGCRLFLGSDAAGVGLNLQHASVVINLDLPWNPAVLEQRIGRVHRLGQKQPVRVVNFVAEKTIEEGMLEVLRFKKSLFAGVLDGGEKEVFLGGSRLTKFMETVEKATASIPERNGDDAADEPAAQAGEDSAAEGTLEDEPALLAQETPAAKPSGAKTSPPAVSAPTDPWSNLLQTGLAFLEQMAKPAGESSSPQGPAAEGQPVSRAPVVARDEQTGESYLKLPVPPADVIEKAVQALSGFLAAFRKW